eukprot:Em0003g937a
MCPRSRNPSQIHRSPGGESELRVVKLSEKDDIETFRAAGKGTEETHRELAIRLGDMANRWLKDVSTVEQIKDAVVLEKFLNCLSSPIKEARKQVKSNGDHNQKGKQSSTPSQEEEGKYVQDILLDTGCSKTLVHQKLVPKGKVLPTTIQCAHGDKVLYPVAQQKAEGVTRAQEEKKRCQKEADSQVSSSPVVLDAQSIAEESAAIKPKETLERHQVGEAEGDNGSVFNLEDSLLSGGRSRSKLSRSPKRAQRRIHQPAVEEQLSSGLLAMSAEELKQLVKFDPSLKNLMGTLGNRKLSDGSCRGFIDQVSAGMLQTSESVARTSPYHPQTDGLVERFNGTLKAMLRKVAGEDVKKWDRWLPFLLFAYREVPQASTGFSPFELLYGRAVRRPLDIVKGAWEGSKLTKDSVVSYVLGVQDKLSKMASLAAEHLCEAQADQKHWYDRNARQREFQTGDLVMVLLTTSVGALTAQ